MSMMGINVADPLGIVQDSGFDEVLDPLGLAKKQQKKIDKMNEPEEVSSGSSEQNISQPIQRLPASKSEITKPTGRVSKSGTVV